MNRVMDAVAVQLYWEVALQTPTRLFCSCRTHLLSTSLSKRSQPRNKTNLDFSSLSTLSQRFDPALPTPPDSSAKHPLRHVNKILQPHSYCWYDAGESDPNSINREALSQAIQYSVLCQCKCPDSLVTTKTWHLGADIHDSESSPYSEWQRRILIGWRGKLPIGNIDRALTLYLKESHPLDRRPANNLAPLGTPLIEFQTEWVPASELAEMAERLEALTMGTGWTRPETGRWTVRLKEGYPATVLQQYLYTRADIHQLQHQLKTTATSSLDEWLQQSNKGFTLVKREDKQQESWEIDESSPPLSSQTYLEEIGENKLPTKGWQLLAEMTLLGLSHEVRWGILRWGHGNLFQECRIANPKVSPKRWGELLYEWPQSLKKKNIPIHQVTPQRYLALASLHGLGKCHREALRDLLAFAAMFPDTSIRHLMVQKMGIHSTTMTELEENISQWLRGPLPVAEDWARREKVWMGRLMDRVRGALPGKLVRRALYKHFTTNPPTPKDKCLFPPSEPRRDS